MFEVTQNYPNLLGQGTYKVTLRFTYDFKVVKKVRNKIFSANIEWY